MRNSDNIIDKLYESRINESKIYTYIVTFSDRMGSHSRVLMSYSGKVNAVKAKKIYDKYCRENDCVFYSIEDATPNDKMVKELTQDEKVDKYFYDL